MTPFLQNYKRVQPELDELADDVASVLGEDFVGLYVFGSLLSADWDPRRSDIDFLVVTRNAVDAMQARKLAAMHGRLAETDFGRMLEGDYVEYEKLKTKDFACKVSTTHGAKFHFDAPCPISADNVLALIQHGVCVRGLAIAELGLGVSPDELTNAVCAMFEEDRKDLETADEGKLLELLIDGLRCLYTVETGELPTKRDAIEHARDLLGDDLLAAVEAYREGKRDAAVSLPRVREVIEEARRRIVLKTNGQEV